MDIDGLSEQTLKTFISMGWLHSLGDIYLLNAYESGMKRLPGFGEKSVNKLLKAIDDSTHCDLQHFLTALSIPGIGEGQTKIIVKKFKTIDDFTSAVDGGYQFSDLPGIGAVLSHNIYSWMGRNRSEFDFLRNIMVFDEAEVDNNTSSDLLRGKTFVITGTVNHFNNRDAVKQKIESLGGKVAGSVSKNTNYLINNDVTSTSGKNKKAKELGVPIISEDEFLEMINEKD